MHPFGSPYFFDPVWFHILFHLFLSSVSSVMLCLVVILSREDPGGSTHSGVMSVADPGQHVSSESSDQTENRDTHCEKSTYKIL